VSSVVWPPPAQGRNILPNHGPFASTTLTLVTWDYLQRTRIEPHKGADGIIMREILPAMDLLAREVLPVFR
jgi:hypothetical protein